MSVAMRGSGWDASDGTLQRNHVRVLQAVADGGPYRLAAKDLGLSEGYVKLLSQQAQQALGADNCAHAIAIAMRRGLIV